MIEKEFEAPDHITVHWDGKILKVKGNIKSNRVCVHIAGADATRVQKLLGVPEVESGTGAAEAQVVKDMLTKWKIREGVVGLVFDTTASNSGIHSGACRHIEDFLIEPVLWLVCQHHIHELYMKHLCITGHTK